MSSETNTISTISILLPKFIGPLAAGILAGLIAYRQMPHPNVIDAIIAGLTLLVPLLGGGLSALGVASKTNPAGVASASAVTVAPSGKPNVTSDPTATSDGK